MRIIALILTLFLFMYSGESVHAKRQTDSVFAVWNNAELPDSTRIQTLYTTVWNEYLFSRPDTAGIMLEQMLELAMRSNYKGRQAILNNALGISYYLLGDHKKSLSSYSKSAAIAKEIGNNKLYSNAIGNKAGVYVQIGEDVKAIECLERSLEIDEAINHLEGKAGTLSNIGSIYNRNGNSTEATQYFERALKLYEEAEHKQGIANLHSNIGSQLLNKKEYDLAKKRYVISLNLFKEINDKSGLAVTYANLAAIMQGLADEDAAFTNYTKGYKVALESGIKKNIASSLLNLGKWHAKNRKLEKAIDYLEQSLMLYEEIQSVSGQQAASNELYEAFKGLGNTQKALLYHEKSILLEDSLKTNETTKQLQQMEFQKQLLADSIANAEKERLVAEAHQEEVRKKNRTRNMLAGSGFLLFILAGGFYSRWRYVRKSRDIISKEKDRSENLLLNILPAEIAKELKEKGRADARDFDMVSILFTDFKGFTAASEKMSAQDLVTEINICFRAFDGIMGKYGIEKIKTIGDAYMAAGGLPVPTDDSVKNTVLAALEMQEFISKRKAELDAQGKAGFEMRVGIHTGPVVAGIVGVKKFQYDIWGDTVNTASRIESSGEVGKVNISQATHELLQGDSDFIFKNRGKIEAKGKGEIEMWFVTAN